MLLLTAMLYQVWSAAIAFRQAAVEPDEGGTCLSRNAMPFAASQEEWLPRGVLGDGDAGGLAVGGHGRDEAEDGH